MTNLKKGLLLSLISSATAGWFLVSYKLAAGHGSPHDAALIMLVSAALLNSLTSTIQSSGRAPFPKDRLSLGLSLGLAVLTLAGNQFAVDAVFRISAPLTSVMQQTQVLFVALLGRIFLAEAVTGRFWVGAALAIGGLCYLQLSPGHAAHIEGVGMAMAVGSAACFGTMAVVTRKYVHRIRPVAVNALRLWMSVGLWFIVEHRLPHGVRDLRFVAYCALAGVFGPFISRTALMYALKYVSPTRTTLIALLTPALTLVPTFFVFGIVPSGRELLGGLVVIAGVAIPLLERARWVQNEPVPASR
jgi:drug/metabolite transporter (DMT)-like permease